MKILSKYVLKEHVGPLVFALSALTSILLLNYIAKQVGKLVGKGLGWRVIGEFLLMSIPFTVAMTLPMAVLVATLYVFSRLSSDNEITGMKAGGIAMGQILVPVLFGAFGIALLNLAFNDQVLPRANHQLAVLQSDIVRKKPTFALREQVIDSVSPGLSIRAGKISQESGWLYDVTISDLTQPAERRTVYADSGELFFSTNQTDTNQTDLVLNLHDGEVVRVNTADAGQIQRSFFQSSRYIVPHVTNTFERSDTENAYKSDREQTVCDMYTEYARAEKTANEEREALARDTGAAPQPVAPPALTLGRGYCTVLAAVFRDSTSIAAVATAVDTTHFNDAPQALPILGEPARGGIVPVSPQLLSKDGTELSAAQGTMNRFNVEIQKKFALAMACLVFVLLGAPIALRFPRSGIGLVIGVSLLVFALYYVALIGGETLADGGYLPPFWAMWAANIVMTAAGIVLLTRMSRASTPTRGGGVRDLMDAVRVSGASLLRRMGIGADRRRHVP